jgi:MinD-like ATPase involved in chromosome partitioning or flagellar assembly
VARPTVAINLPADEAESVVAELATAGFPTEVVRTVDELADLLRRDPRVGVAILDAEGDLSLTLELYGLLHEEDRSIPALMIVAPRDLERFAQHAGATLEDEYFARPYSTDSLRWRVEAMCIRLQTVDDGSGDVLSGADVDTSVWGRRAQIVTVFNPKGGVGKTTLATNIAATLRTKDGHDVLLVDADTVTGHVTTSLALEHVRTVADAWRDEAEGGPTESLVELTSQHESGLRVIALTDSPVHTDILEAERVANAIASARKMFDYIVVDLHPSYSQLNLAIFIVSDRILVPVTPDVPAIRAAVQFRDVARELGLLDRVSLVINRANSGVSVEDIEKTVGLTSIALVRSAGMQLVRAANEGKTLIERYPRELVTTDFHALVDKLTGKGTTPPARSGFRLFGRKVAARA